MYILYGLKGGGGLGGLDFFFWKKIKCKIVKINIYGLILYINLNVMF